MGFKFAQNVLTWISEVAAASAVAGQERELAEVPVLLAAGTVAAEDPGTAAAAEGPGTAAAAVGEDPGTVAAAVGEDLGTAAAVVVVGPSEPAGSADWRRTQ